MKLWLAQRFGGAGKTLSSAPANAAGQAVVSLEHMLRSRIRVYLRNTWLVAILGTAILAGGVWLAFYLTSKDTVMKVAAGPAGGVDAGLVEFLTKKVAHGGESIGLKLVTTSGPAQSAQAIADRTVDVAVLPANVGASADWPVVAILRQNAMVFIVPAPEAATPAPAAPSEATPGVKPEEGKEAKESKSKRGAKAAKGKSSAKEAKGAKADEAKSEKGDETEESTKHEKVSQLAGRRIGIVTGNEASTDLLSVVLTHYGIPLDKVQISQIDPKNLADAVKNNQVDVLFVAGPATGHAIAEAVAAARRNGAAPSFMEIDQADAIAKRDVAFDSTTIDAGMFAGNPAAPADSLKTLTFPEYLVARNTSRHDRIATLARLVYSSRQSLAAAMPGEVKIEAPSTDKDSTVIVHPGALVYLNDDQKSFFDKYGDYIFYSLLIFPIFGSRSLASPAISAPADARGGSVCCSVSLTSCARRMSRPRSVRSISSSLTPTIWWSPSSIRASTTTTMRRYRCRFRLRSTRPASPSPRGAPPCSASATATPSRVRRRCRVVGRSRARRRRCHAQPP
jgi:TRAP-type uncharacterized transport system substrate-binding protein